MRRYDEQRNRGAKKKLEKMRDKMNKKLSESESELDKQTERGMVLQRDLPVVKEEDDTEGEMEVDDDRRRKRRYETRDERAEPKRKRSMSSSEYSMSEPSEDEASVRGGAKSKKKKNEGSKGKKNRKYSSEERPENVPNKTMISHRRIPMWKGKWESWGILVREKIGEWKREENDNEKKKRSGEMPTVFRTMGKWVKDNYEIWEEKGLNILKADAEEFASVSMAQSWKENDDVMIYPSCKAVEHMEKLYKYLTRGSLQKNDQKVKEILKITKIDTSIKTKYNPKLTGEDVYVAISYIAYLYMGYVGGELFKRRA